MLNYAFGVALAWLLVPSEFGTVSALQNLLLLTAGALAAGLPWALAVKVAGSPRAPTADPKEIRTGVLGNVGFGLLIASGFLVVQLGGPHLIPGAGAAMTLTVACTIPLIGLSTVMAGTLQGTRRFGGLGAMQAGEILVKCVVGIALVVIAHLGPEGVALGFLVGSLAANAVGLRALRGLLPGPGPLARLREFRSAVPIWAGTASFTVLLTADILALGPLGRVHGVTAGAVAAYQVCAILARASFYVTDALIDAVFPFMARSRDSRATSHGWFVAAVRWVPLFVVPVHLALVFAPAVVLGVFFPHSYGGSGSLLQLITIGTLGLLLTNMLIKGLYALRCANRVGRRMPWAAFVEVVALVTLIPRYGAIGAAIAYSLAAWTGVILLTPVYLRRQQVGLPGWTLRGRYLLALTPSVALLAATSLVPDQVALVLIVLALSAFAAMARLTRLITDHDIRRLRGALTAARSRAGTLRGIRHRKPVPSGVPDPAEHPATAPTATARPSAPSAGPRYPPLHLVSTRRRASLRTDLLLVVGGAALAALVTLTNLFSSPDNVYDEVVYTAAARNLAATWHLTWTNPPVFVHPPLFFLLQAAWLKVTGQATGPLINSVHAARLLTGIFEVLNVGLLALLTYRLAAHCGASRRRTLAVSAAVVACLDPVLLRYSRLAIIEPVALALSLLTLTLAWSLRRRRPLSYVSIVGLCTGGALLTKELTIFLVVSPLLFACLERDRQLLGRTLGALGVGLACWLLFPLWAVQLGLTGEFFQVQTRTLQRLVGLIQATGWNRPGVSFESAVLRSASQYVSSYVALALGFVAIAWLWWRRNTQAGNFLCAWLTTSFGLGAFLVTVGTLNEQFFVYVLPACIVASVFMVDALLMRADIRGRAVSWPTRFARSAVIAAVAVLGTTLAGASVVSWIRQYSGDNQGVARAARTIATMLPSCSIVNGSGDPEKYFYLLGGREVSYYSEGPAAVSHGIHYFILAPNDVVAHYGNMTPSLAAWIRGRGTLVASFPSKTYDAVQLWHVPADDYDPVADMEYVPAGVYVNTAGSRCGGLTVTDGPRGDFFSGYLAHGGKPLLGKPITRVTRYNGESVQVFDGAVLAAPFPAATTGPVALAVVHELALRAPSTYRKLMLPPLSRANMSASTARRRAWLSDPAIAKVFLGNSTSLRGFDAGVQRFGPPLGPVTNLPNGWVAQAFADVVLERRRSTGPVRAAPIWNAALAAGLLKLPQDALSDEAPPPLPISHVCGDQGCLIPLGPAQPSSVLPFVRSLLAATFLFAITISAIARLRRRSVPLEAADENAA